jgi:hypothetical protein
LKTFTFEELEEAIASSWSADTSANKNWRESNPALGQCAVTACVLQDFIGGEIVNSKVIKPDGSIESHYYNLLTEHDDVAKIDLTESQFTAGSIIPDGQAKTGDFDTTREYVLANPNTQARYELLKRKVELYLASL